MLWTLVLLLIGTFGIRAGEAQTTSTLDKIRERKELRAGTAPVAPFNLIGKDGKWYGMNIDIGEKLAAKLGVKLTWVETSWDVANFQRYVLEQAGGTLEEDGRISAFGRTSLVRCFPIGIDVDNVHDMAHTPEADARIEQLVRRRLNRGQILGRDRLWLLYKSDAGGERTW